MDNNEIDLYEYIDTSDATAKPGDILAGKTAVARGQEITGTITSQAGGTYTPGTSSQVVAQRGKMVTSDIKINGDPNLVPANIKKNVTILGVKGTSEGWEPPTKLPDGVYSINITSDPVGAWKGNQKIASAGMKVGVTAEPSDWYYSFKEWLENGDKISGEETLTFNVNGNKNLIAKFNVLPHYTISVSAFPEEGGIVSGGGIYGENSEVTLEAELNDKYWFDGWYEESQNISNLNPYTFTPTIDADIIGKFSFVNGLSWNIANIPLSTDWSSIAYGNGKFVAISYFDKSSSNRSNKAIYSADGVNWSITSMPVSAYWKRIVYGNDKFVAIETDIQYAAYSIDGISWVQTTMPVSGQWNDVAYGNGKFVSVASVKCVASYSTDGITWSPYIRIPSNNPHCIAFGGDKFVVIDYNQNSAAYSFDGISWATTTMPSVKNWKSVVYGNDKFVAISYNSNAAAYSLDGITWFATTLPHSANWSSITYGDGKFIAIAEDSSKFAYSLDGITFLETNMPYHANWSGIAYGDGKFIAIASNIDEVAYTLLEQEVDQ